MHTEKNDDNRLIARALNGQSEAFRPLVEKYWSLVFSVVRRYVKDNETTTDICQEAFCAAYFKLNQFRENSKFSPWLVRIAVNKALEYLRREQRSPIVSIDPGLIESWQPKALSAKEDPKEFFDECLEKLNEELQILFILRHGIDFSYDDIAFVLDVPVGTVKVALFRLRNQLKDAFLAKQRRESALHKEKEQADGK
jgi:RNA polymerase sigma-70 factor (ECF subfamily)